MADCRISESTIGRTMADIVVVQEDSVRQDTKLAFAE